MNAVVKTLIKQFLPEIKDKAAPVTEELLLDVLNGKNEELRSDEERADIVIENARGHVVVYICAMTRDNRITRVLMKYELPELVELLLSNLDKI